MYIATLKVPENREARIMTAPLDPIQGIEFEGAMAPPQYEEGKGMASRFKT